MRSARLLAVMAVAALSVPGLIRAEDLSTVSDLDLLATAPLAAADLGRETAGVAGGVGDALGEQGG